MYKVALLALASSLFAVAQTPSSAGTPAEIVVTVGHYFSPETPVLTKDSLTITQHYDPLPITNLVPLRGGLELFLLVDNCSSCEPGTKFQELRRFILAQPPTTAIGVAYIRNGKLEVAENPTQDRERAVKALNVPEGNKPTNPYQAVTDLIKSWRQNSSRRAILMITNGIDPAAPEASPDPLSKRRLRRRSAPVSPCTRYIIPAPITFRAIRPASTAVKFSLRTSAWKPAAKPTSSASDRCPPWRHFWPT